MTTKVKTKYKYHQTLRHVTKQLLTGHHAQLAIIYIHLQWDIIGKHYARTNQTPQLWVHPFTQATRRCIQVLLINDANKYNETAQCQWVNMCHENTVEVGIHWHFVSDTMTLDYTLPHCSVYTWTLQGLRHNDVIITPATLCLDGGWLLVNTSDGVKRMFFWLLVTYQRWLNVYGFETLTVAFGRESKYVIAPNQTGHLYNFLLLWIVLNVFIFRCLDRLCTGWRRWMNFDITRALKWLSRCTQCSRDLGETGFTLSDEVPMYPGL